MLSALVVAGVVYGFVRFFAGAIGRSAADAARAHGEAAVLVERQRIARDMHDNVAQALFYLAVKLREVDGMLPATGAGPARDELREAARNLNEAYGQVREAITDLKEQADLENFGAAVRRTAQHASERFGLRVECRVEGEPGLPARSAQHLLAIIQEAVANARRHGKVRTVSVVAKEEEGGIVIEVGDRGAGFDTQTIAQENGGHGLAIMAERTRRVGGDLRVDSAPGRGTRVRVYVPEAGS